MPLAAIDVAASPKKTYAVHVDHLNRPIMLTDAAKVNVWWASYELFGKVRATGGTLTQNLGLPDQWFQLENGLAHNWHRHYDPTTRGIRRRIRWGSWTELRGRDTNCINRPHAISPMNGPAFPHHGS